MKKLNIALQSFVLALLFSTSTFATAWDGAVFGKISDIHVAPGDNYGFRITLAGVSAMCAGSPAGFAYLNDTDSNYKVFIAMLMLAQARNATVTIYTNLDGGYCHIGYVVVNNAM